MKRILFILLMCLIITVAVFAADMSPQPGDIPADGLNIQIMIIGQPAAAAPDNVKSAKYWGQCLLYEGIY